MIMELIRISENKIKIMLNANDMSAYDLPTEGIDYCENSVREAFRAVLKDAGKKTGLDFSDGRLSIQLYPSKAGGCEMFVTRTATGGSGRTRTESGGIHVKNPATKVKEEDGAPRWERSEAFAFESMKWLLSVCKRLRRIGFTGNSAAFRDETGRCFLVIDTTATLRSQIIEYGTGESAEAVRLYISEHGSTICPRNAIEILGAL